MYLKLLFVGNSREAILNGKEFFYVDPNSVQKGTSHYISDLL